MAVTKSWVEGAEGSDFPVENLPLGVFRRADGKACVATAISEWVLDLRGAADAHVIPGQIAVACRENTLNRLMAMGGEGSRALRAWLMDLLTDENARPRVEPLLVKRADVQMLLPVRVGDYTDFYASVYHATNVGKLFRPENPLLPNYKWVPIGYHGRASSIVVSGTDVKRPDGQRKAPDADAPTFGPSRMLDYELEVGCYVGEGNGLGEAVPLKEARQHIFGLCLVNDWSARDVQAWEYQPLGPFLAKNFATTVSPWVVTMEALEPFRVAAFTRAEGDPKPLAYLDDADDQRRGGLDVTLEVWLRTARMRSEGAEAVRVSRGNMRDLYWTVAQMLAHHTSNGCNLQAGDLLATGTVSGAEAGTQGCLLEITRRGADPLELPNGEKRTFLEDGDEVILRGYCEREGHARIGFGECVGRVVG
ncbi:MAG TPA: fumarylacetoacetase [Acidobacteriaceae bacterium]|nr:fumarylacetoacetase [Acidobacteriaceae bacterium]